MVLEAGCDLDLGAPGGDEEIVGLSESDACRVDAAQGILSCTLGKGNLLLRLGGKAAMSFFKRSRGKGCRIVWNGTGDDSLSKSEKIHLLLSDGAEKLFSIQPLSAQVPETALLSRSVSCAACGERTSEAMTRPFQGSLYCLDCWPDHSRILG